MTRIAVTGGSGKLGRAVIADLTAHGNEVVNLDVAAPAPRPQDRPDRLRADRRGAHRHRRPLRQDRRGGAPGGDPGARAHPERGDVPPQHHRDLQRLLRRAAGRHHQRRVGVQRDRARAAVPHAAAVHPGRRGVSGPARVDVLAGQAPRGADGRAVLPVATRAEDDRAALLQRDGPRGLRRVPGFRRRPARGAAGTCGATSTPATARRRSGGRWRTRRRAWRSSSSPTPTR